MKPTPSKQQKNPIISDSRSTQINFLWDKYKGPFILRIPTPYSIPSRGGSGKKRPLNSNLLPDWGGGGEEKELFSFLLIPSGSRTGAEFSQRIVCRHACSQPMHVRSPGHVLRCWLVATEFDQLLSASTFWITIPNFELVAVGARFELRLLLDFGVLRYSGCPAVLCLQ